ncbi:hypothetical protein F3L20_03775 [Streptomyces tendae]|uniref:Uncharacterized protein n=1 Tax=Streptomyces tendae TaxID=1932 RepID=A0ABX5ZZU9_STRTE|nr:hypothetical protein F3L20_03775 [Streptomyces tendae]
MSRLLHRHARSRLPHTRHLDTPPRPASVTASAATGQLPRDESELCPTTRPCRSPGPVATGEPAGAGLTHPTRRRTPRAQSSRSGSLRVMSRHMGW